MSSQINKLKSLIEKLNKIKQQVEAIKTNLEVGPAPELQIELERKRQMHKVIESILPHFKEVNQHLFGIVGTDTINTAVHNLLDFKITDKETCETIRNRVRGELSGLVILTNRHIDTINTDRNASEVILDGIKAVANIFIWLATLTYAPAFFSRTTQPLYDLEAQLNNNGATLNQILDVVDEVVGTKKEVLSSLSAGL